MSKVSLMAFSISSYISFEIGIQSFSPREVAVLGEVE